MPSLLTARNGSAGGSNSNGRTLSRVTSFKREWDDDGPEASTSSQPIPWSSSPEPVKRKMSSDPEAAKEARRKAIMAALNPNTSSSSSSSSAPTATATSSTAPSSAAATLVTAKPRIKALVEMDDDDEPQIVLNTDLPSIPKNLPSRKREMPWDERMGATKKANRTGSNGKPGTKAKKAGGGNGNMNIKQQVILSTEQQKVLQYVVAEGKNMFFTGSAGTGKSVLLREIIAGLRKKYVQNPEAVAVTASTGIAACNIGGVTLHSFGGVGLALEEAPILLGKLRKNKKAMARWLRTKTLIIDEVSMVDGEMFDKFNKLGQMVRKNPKPFGGLQIIVTGDFFQLPPVTKGGAQPKFCFDAQTWAETISMSVNLTKVFRQKDERFVTMLNEMRFGRLSATSIAAFKSLTREVTYKDGVAPTVLYPRREDVDRANETELAKLNTDGYTYASTDSGAVTDPVQRAKLLANFMAPETLQLKVDAQVMLIKNINESLVNGTMGKVIGFEYHDMFTGHDSGRWEDDDEKNYADDDETQAGRESRAQKRERYRRAGMRKQPVVRFYTPSGKLDMCMEPDSFKTELPNGEVQAARMQLPLILAWAMSIHKSQGQTLDRVKVDLGKVFEKGQAYVALSRATSLEGLQVLGFNAEKVQAHRRVAAWSRELKDLNEL